MTLARGVSQSPCKKWSFILKMKENENNSIMATPKKTDIKTLTP